MIAPVSRVSTLVRPLRRFPSQLASSLLPQSIAARTFASTVPKMRTTGQDFDGGMSRSTQLSNRRNDLQITDHRDDAVIRDKYRPFLLDERVAASDWISKLELDTVEDMVRADLAATNGDRLRVLVLYGSLRAR